MDAARVKQVLLNLLANAVKFSPEGGNGLDAGVSDDGAVRVEVGDTGPGIEQQDQQKIFLEFQQAARDSGKPEGTGLGLTLAKRFVELHGGKMWLESESEGAAGFFSLCQPHNSESRASLCGSHETSHLGILEPTGTRIVNPRSTPNQLNGTNGVTH